MSCKIDSLQDICIFYCVNHLDTLASLLECYKQSSDEAYSSFSMLLGNKITEYYYKCQIGEDAVQPYVDAILRTPQFCNSVIVNRKFMLTADNVSHLAQNAIKVLEFTCFDDYKFIKENFEGLVKNNLKNITRLKIKQKSTECDIEGLLQLLCGGEEYRKVWKQDKNTNNSKPKLKFNKVSPYFSEPSLSNLTSSLASQSPSTLDTAAHDSDSDTDIMSPCSSSSVIKQESQSDRYLPNLVSFHYNMCYSSLENLTNSYAVFDRLCCIIEKNTQLQSITIISVMPNPCKWFLLNTDMVHKLGNLHSLVLSYATRRHIMDIELGSVLFSKLPQLRKLRHLDLSYGFESQSSETQMMYSDAEVDMFREALKQMPKLKSIDVSGSNLCNIIGHANNDDDLKCTDHCMPGFKGRMFDYIGLFNCEPCCHQFIPALRVSGNTNENQLLVAVWTYHHNQLIMSQVLTELRHIVAVDDSTVSQGLAFIEGLLLYLEELGDWDAKYTEAKQLELRNVHSTLINLYYLLKLRDVRTNMSIKTERLLIERMMVMSSTVLEDVNLCVICHADPNVILRICLLVFRIIHAPSVVVYSHKFESYIKLMLNVLHSRAKHHVKMLALGCIHDIVRYSQEYKKLAGGKLQLVKVLLETISISSDPTTDQQERDGKMWSIIWTLTDDVPANCERFVAHSGCTIAQNMIKTQPDDADLLRKITGALSNVSENLHLHPYLMEQNMVNLMRKLLTPFDSDYYDISSHAAAYLILLVATGPESWTLQSPTHPEIMKDVDNVIKEWNINESKGVRFRTLVPMLNQITNARCPVAQHWGSWMICNLLLVKPEGYCDMLISENGLTIIDAALSQPDLREDIRQIMERILQLTRNFKAERLEYQD